MFNRATVVSAPSVAFVALVSLASLHVACGDAARSDVSSSTIEGVSAIASGPIHPHASSGLCLDVVGQGTANGTAVEVWACSGLANQQWVYDGTSLRVYGNKCLDVTGEDTTLA